MLLMKASSASAHLCKKIVLQLRGACFLIITGESDLALLQLESPRRCLGQLDGRHGVSVQLEEHYRH